MQYFFFNNSPHKRKQTAYGDLTGQFPFQSSTGNKYIYVMYNYDSNAILVQAIQNRQAQTIAHAWEALTKRINKNGKRFNNFILDNEISSELKKAFKKYNSQQNRPFRLSKIIFYWDWQHATRNSQSANGINYFIKRKLP